MFNSQPDQIRKMIFNLCLFNAAVLERRNYGSLGFSLPYDFNDSDLEVGFITNGCITIIHISFIDINSAIARLRQDRRTCAMECAV